MNEREGYRPIRPIEALDLNIKTVKRLKLAGYGLASASVANLGLGVVANVVIGNYELAALGFGASGLAGAGATYGIRISRRTLEMLNKTRSLITETNNPARQ